MISNRKQAQEACHFLTPFFPSQPEFGILTGTGLSDLLDTLMIHHRLNYTDIPHFPSSTVESHKGSLISASFENRPILLMQGRFHLYEGYTAEQVTFPVRVMQEMGIQRLILTNAAGGINLAFSSGDIMLIRDHINLTGSNPLTGPNTDDWGIRFPDMTRVYHPALQETARKAARENKIHLREGVYAGLQGPSLETPAETRFLKTIGADAVGFSTVMEAIAGVHASMDILGISLITNINDPDAPEETTLEGVVKTAGKTLPVLSQLLTSILQKTFFQAG